MYLFTFYNSKVSLPSFRPRAHEPAHNSNSDDVREYSLPVPAVVEKLNQQFHPASNEKAFNKGELMRYARNSSTSLSIN